MQPFADRRRCLVIDPATCPNFPRCLDKQNETPFEPLESSSDVRCSDHIGNLVFDIRKVKSKTFDSPLHRDLTVAVHNFYLCSLHRFLAHDNPVWLTRV